jgi:preprotein translocase subunit SecE
LKYGAKTVTCQSSYPNGISTKGQIMAKTNPVQFIQQTRAEIGKVVWPSRREVTLTTIMVLIMAAVMALFFTLVDMIIRLGLDGVLNAF